jgi:hypothetical protein
MLHALPYLYSKQPVQPLLSYKCISLRLLTLLHCSFQFTHTSQVLRLFGHHEGLCYLTLTHWTVIHLWKLSTDVFQTAARPLQFILELHTSALHTHTAVPSYWCCRHLVSEHSKWYTKPPLSLYANVACYDVKTHGSFLVTVGARTTVNDADCRFL